MTRINFITTVNMVVQVNLSTSTQRPNLNTLHVVQGGLMLKW